MSKDAGKNFLWWRGKFKQRSWNPAENINAIALIRKFHLLHRHPAPGCHLFWCSLFSGLLSQHSWTNPHYLPPPARGHSLLPKRLFLHLLHYTNLKILFSLPEQEGLFFFPVLCKGALLTCKFCSWPGLFPYLVFLQPALTSLHIARTWPVQCID